MTLTQMKDKAFEDAWNNICEGCCDNHIGECKVVFVPEMTSFYSFCDRAVKSHRELGISVEVQNLVKISRVDDKRTPEQRYRDEAGFRFNDTEDTR